MSSPTKITTLPPELIYAAGQYLDVESLASACISGKFFNEAFCQDPYLLRYLAKRYLTTREIAPDEWQYIVGDIRHLQTLDEISKLIYAAERDYVIPVMEIINASPVAATTQFDYLQGEPVPGDVKIISNDKFPSGISDKPSTLFVLYNYLSAAAMIAAAYNYLPLFILLMDKAKSSAHYGDYEYDTAKAAAYNASLSILNYLLPSLKRLAEDLQLELIANAFLGNNIDTIGFFIANNIGVPTPQDMTSVDLAAQYLDSVNKFKWFLTQFPYANYATYASVAFNKTGAGPAIAKYLYEERGIPLVNAEGLSPEMEDFASSMTAPDFSERIKSPDDPRVATIVYLIGKDKRIVYGDFLNNHIKAIRNASIAALQR